MSKFNLLRAKALAHTVDNILKLSKMNALILLLKTLAYREIYYFSIPKSFLPAQFSLHIISAVAPLNITFERIGPSFSDLRAVFVIYQKPTLKRYLNRKLRRRKSLRIDCSNSYCQDRNSYCDSRSRLAP